MQLMEPVAASSSNRLEWVTVLQRRIMCMSNEQTCWVTYKRHFILY